MCHRQQVLRATGQMNSGDPPLSFHGAHAPPVQPEGASDLTGHLHFRHGYGTGTCKGQCAGPLALEVATGVRKDMPSRALSGSEGVRQAGWVLFSIGPGRPLGRADLSRVLGERRAGGRRGKREPRWRGQQVPVSGRETGPGRAEEEEAVSPVGLRPDRGDFGLSHVWV